MLEVRFLGQFDVRLDGDPVDIPSRPAQSLFAYLILNAGKSHRREMLAGLFWPESDEKNARANLRHALWRLRKSLDQYIEADKLTVAFKDEAPYHLDADELAFEPDGVALDEYMRRMDEYQGGLLPGFYEDWVVSERERLEALFNKRMQQLLERLTSEERWAAVLEWAERWIARSSLPEEAYRALMRGHAAVGDSAGVAMTYERLVENLQEELGVEPSLLTQSLYEELTEMPQQPSGPGGPTDVDSTESRDKWVVQPPPKPDFLEEERDRRSHIELVARDAELSELDVYLNNMLQGTGSVSFIVGEAGRGKSSLVNEFARRAEHKNEELLVLTGSCDVYTGREDPFRPFREIMTMMVGDVTSHWSTGSISREQARRVWDSSPEAVSELVQRGPNLLDSIVPRRVVGARHSEEPGAAPSLSRSSTSGSANTTAPHKSRILEEYTNVLVGLAERNPLILILEDLHWIDPSSADLLLSLTKAVSLNRILILGTYRPEEIQPQDGGGEHPLRMVLTEVKRRFGDVWINLDSGDRSQDRMLVDRLIDREPNKLSNAFRERLVEITSGHPLFVQELLREMRERGDLVRDESGKWIQSDALNWDILPIRVEGVIEQRIERLDGELREALSIASVQGELFFAEVVADVMGVDRNGLRRRFSRDLEHRHRLVMEVGTERVGEERVSEFRFRHILIQRYLARQLGRGELAQLHHTTASSLEKLFEHDSERVAHRLGRHFTEAGLHSAAVEYLAEAGRQALRVSANQEAIKLLDRALDLLSAGGSERPPGEKQVSDLLRARIWRYSGEAYYRLGDLEQSRQRLERALTFLGENEIAGRQQLKLSLALQVIRQILHRLAPSALLRRLGRDTAVLRERAYIYKMLAEVYLFSNDTLPTAYAAVNALNTAELAGPSPELVRASADMANAMPMLRLTSQGVHYRDRAMEVASQVGDPAATAYAYLGTGYFDAGEGNWGRARRAFDRSIEFHEAAGDLNLLGIGYDLLSHVAVLEGNLEEHRKLARELLEVAEKSGSLQHKTWALDGLTLNRILASGFEGLEDGLERARESLELIDKFPAATERMTVLVHMAEIHLRLGNEERVTRLCKEAAEIMAQSPPASFALWPAYFTLPLVLLELIETRESAQSEGLLDEAQWAVEQSRAFARVYPIGRPRAATMDGLLDFLKGNRSRAMQAWRKGIKLSRDMEMPLETALAHYQIGRHVLEEDERRSQHLSVAEEIYSRHSSQMGVELVRSVGG